MTTTRHFAQDDDPPPFKRVTPLRRVKGGEEVKVTVLGEKVQGFWQHWLKGRAEPCLTDVKLCRWCLMNPPIPRNKWSGFLCCWDMVKQEACFIELTRLARDRVKQLAVDRPHFRGMILQIGRERKANNSPFTIILLGETPPHKILPKPIDVRPTLERVWGLDPDGQGNGSPV